MVYEQKAVYGTTGVFKSETGTWKPGKEDGGVKKYVNHEMKKIPQLCQGSVQVLVISKILEVLKSRGLILHFIFI